MSSKEVKDISITITSFHLKFVGFWIADNHTERLWMNFALFYTFGGIFFSLTVEMRDLYFTWGDFGVSEEHKLTTGKIKSRIWQDTIYITCNVITIILVLMKIFVLLIYYDELQDIIHYAKRNFWHLDYDSYEQMIINKCKRTCTIFVCIFTFFAEGTVATYVIRPLIANHGKNESDRILPFNMWLYGLHTSFTPYFEMIFSLQVIGAHLVGVCYHCFDNILCILNLHTAAQFRILQYRLANVCNTNDHKKFHERSGKSWYSIYKYGMFKAHIQQHQALIEFCGQLEDVFNTLVLGQVSLFSLLICLDGYLILMDDGPLSRRFTFLFHITGCMCQLLMFTYSCDCLIRDSMDVANAAYKSLWPLLPMDKCGKMLRRD
ncbi:unnamed protein product, partial [Heterotrigona itama]